MLCTLCGRRKARRACPAVAREICAVCCGTKRLVEIRCPSDCGYLAAARAHPPAIAHRQQDRDFRFLATATAGLSEGQLAMVLMLQQIVARNRPASLPPLNDRDVAEAAEALAATFETADRGIIYEHHPTSVTAVRLAAAWREVFAEVRQRTGRAPDRDAAIALRRLQRAALSAGSALEGGDTAYLELIERLKDRTALEGPGAGRQADAPVAASRLIVP